jgi:polar amino acid transport system substrate-binding protein
MALLGGTLLLSCGGNHVRDAARSELAQSGRIRAGINFGNALLAVKDAEGRPAGIAVDLARELAGRLEVPLEIVPFDTAARLAAGAKAGVWDVGFLGADPDRAGEIAFTAPYLEIDATYLVPPGSPLRLPADVDRAGVRIAVSEKSAYDLFLTRSIRNAALVRVPGVDASVKLFFSEKLDALAGLRPLLMQVAGEHPGTQVLQERFMTVHQALGTPREREAAARYLNDFVEEIRVSGVVEATIRKNRISGVSVAPPASAP